VADLLISGPGRSALLSLLVAGLIDRPERQQVLARQCCKGSGVRPDPGQLVTGAVY